MGLEREHIIFIYCFELKFVTTILLIKIATVSSRMSHLDFLLGMEWKEESSRVVRRLVQTHSHLPQVWIYAARFELEMKVILEIAFIHKSRVFQTKDVCLCTNKCWNKGKLYSNTGGPHYMRSFYLRFCVYAIQK